MRLQIELRDNVIGCHIGIVRDRGWADKRRKIRQAYPVTHVMIIGAGVVGAAIAYRLARAGARVTVVDQAGPAAGSSGTSFGWLNASFYADDDHHRLRVAGLDAMRRLADELPDAAITWQPAIWFEEQGAGLARMKAQLGALGYPCAALDRATVADLVPGLVAPDAALRFDVEGVVDGARLTKQLMQAATQLGVRSILGTRVHGLLRTGDRVIGVATGAGHLYADQVIVAAGIGAADLIGIPMLRRPGLLMKSNMLPIVLKHVLVTPEGEVKQDAQGRFVMPTAVAHQADDTEAFTAGADVLADAAMLRLQSLFPGLPLVWTEVAMAMRPVPKDGLPVIGSMGPGLYAAVMHSGMTLAAITAEHVAAEVLDDVQVDLLLPYRPDRFRSV